jgi:hypothetical protein
MREAGWIESVRTLKVRTKLVRNLPLPLRRAVGELGTQSRSSIHVDSQ